MKQRGMTVVELIVVLAIMSIVTGALYSTFVNQQSSYTRQSQIQNIQESAQTGIVILKRDIMMAGYGVDKSLALYIKDGGSTGPDEIYINDASFIDESDLLDSIYGETGFTGSGTSNITVDTLDIDSDGTNDFQGGVWQCIITDNGTNKAAKINSISGNQLSLNSSVSGSYVAPAIYYCVDSEELKRSDRSSGGRQPIISNIVDLQVAYKDTNGNWYCDGTGSCPMSPFNPEDISLVRITLISRIEKKTGRHLLSRPISAENGPTWGNDKYRYRAYSVSVCPRNLRF